jgi:diguanylate cyclase (GGDEF)-like protein
MKDQKAVKDSHLYTAISIGIAVAILIFMLGHGVVLVVESLNKEKQQVITTKMLSTIRARLEGAINSTLHLSSGLRAFISAHPDVTQNEFEELASEIILQGRNIRNIALARNNIINYMYPLQGNEAAIGLNYREHPLQWGAVKRMMDSANTIVAGPVNLIQGGRGFIARSPIFIRHSDNNNQLTLQYWGLVSIVIDMPALLKEAEFENIVEGISFAMRGKDGLGAEGDFITGIESVFDNEAISQEVTLPTGSWQIAAYPINGWALPVTSIWLMYSLVVFLAILISTLIGLLIRGHYQTIAYATHDQLTGLPNRRLLDDRATRAIKRASRTAEKFTLFYLDLNGFKQINDTYGHRAGDVVLKEISGRLAERIRGDDSVARVGGDEFVVLALGIHQKQDISLFKDKLTQMIMELIIVNAHIHTINVAIGTATYPYDGDDLSSLLFMADKNMYLAKQQHYQDAPVRNQDNLVPFKQNKQAG